MRFDIITIFPRIFDSYCNESIIKRARAKKLVDIRIHDLRKFSRDRHKKVDDKPYGGGAGMVLMAEPIVRAVEKIKVTHGTKVVILSAKGKQFNQKIAYGWARKYKKIILISGRYEGVDERVKTILRAEEISIGPYVTTDGDIAAMIIVSAVTRLIPGVIRLESLKEESHGNPLLGKEKMGLLEYPHYTRPDVLIYRNRRYRVPPVLLSGDHSKIAAWRMRHRK